MSSLHGAEHRETVINESKRTVLTRDGTTVNCVQNMVQIAVG